MRPIKIAVILTAITLMLLFSGFAAALNQDEASVRVFFSPENPSPGQTVTVTIFFTTSITDSVQVTYVGINFDWMPSEGFYGFNLSTAPVTVAPNSPYAFNTMTVQIPADTAQGIHTYFVGVSGIQGSSTFDWSSTPTQKQIGSSTQPAVTPTPTNTNSGGGTGGGASTDLYAEIAAVAIVIVLIVIVLLVRKRQKAPKQAAAQGAEQKPEKEKPSPETPETKPSSDDFNI